MAQFPQTQRRSIYIKQQQAFDLLEGEKAKTQERAVSPGDINIAISVDRTSLQPCLTVSTANAPEGPFLRLPFDFENKMSPRMGTKTVELADETISFLRLPFAFHEPMLKYIRKLWPIFGKKEAFLLNTRVSITNVEVVVHEARFGLDDAAFRTSGRQRDVQGLRNFREEVPEEVKAERLGATYVKYC